MMWWCLGRRTKTAKFADDVETRGTSSGLLAQTSQVSGIHATLGQPPSQEYPWTQRALTLVPPLLIPSYRPIAPSLSASLSPFPRHGHAVAPKVTPKGELYLFGGLAQDIPQNDLHLLSMKDFTASLLHTTGGAPHRRFGHATALIGNVLIVWGGDTRTHSKAEAEAHDEELDDGLYLLNLVSREWTRVWIEGAAPEGRYGHGAAMIGAKFYVFGGRAGGRLLNDLWAFDLNSLRTGARWERVEPATGSPVPDARRGHTCVAYEGKLVLFGGADGPRHYNDTWAFDTETARWLKLLCEDALPLARAGHAGAVVNHVLYVVGGSGADGKALPGVCALKLNAWKLRWRTLEAAGPDPGALTGHAVASFGARMFIVGGNTADAATDADMIHVLNTERITQQ